jgi:HD-GYP domain-containing protein (c-di-GMP phosphodiesterase class II)
MSYRPGLNGLYTHLESVLASAWRDGTRPAVLLVVCDPVAAVGAMLGEDRVEQTMTTLVECLAAEVGADALVERFAALEVAVVLRDVSGHDALATRIDQVDAAFVAASARLSLPRASARIGTAVATPGNRSATRLLDAADAALSRGRPSRREARQSAMALSAVLGVREGVALAHPWHVATLSRNIAAELDLDREAVDLDREAVDDCELAGLLHDVGKFAVPERVLLHDGPLDASGWEAMRRHPQAGAELLARVPSLRHLAPIVLHHHERYDGGGYPRGLAGDEIPLEARIVAVADAYSAITAHRPYRASRTPMSAGDALRDGADGHFDPRVVQALESVIALDQAAA